jgi:hypothetical protein
MYGYREGGHDPQFPSYSATHATEVGRYRDSYLSHWFFDKFSILSDSFSEYFLMAG